MGGDAKDGATLATSNGGWTGSPTLKYGYEWERCNSEGAACSPIAEATGSSYTVQRNTEKSASMGTTTTTKQTIARTTSVRSCGTWKCLCLRFDESGEDAWLTLVPPRGSPFGAVPAHTNDWAVAEALYHHLRETGLAEPLAGKETPHAGDLVFFQWRPPGWKPYEINHMGMIVSGNSDDPEHEMYTSHTKNRLIPMSEELKQIGAYMHTLEPKFAASKNARGVHWEWFILRPTHPSVYATP